MILQLEELSPRMVLEENNNFSFHGYVVIECSSCFFSRSKNSINFLIWGIDFFKITSKPLKTV